MLSSLLLSLALRAQEPAPSASALISTMFQRYASTKSLSATIRTTQSAGGVSVVTDTRLAYERPAKIRLDQSQAGTTIRKRGLLVCDGANVVYTKPDYLLHVESPYLAETLAPRGGEPRKLEELYALAASAMPDRSPVLDALVGRPDDLKYFAGQLAAFNLTGRETVNGKSANLIEGEWREAADRRPSGRFRLYLTDEGEIVRYVLVQNFAAPAAGSRQGRAAAGSEPIQVTTTWDATVQLNPEIKPGTFAIKE